MSFQTVCRSWQRRGGAALALAALCPAGRERLSNGRLYDSPAREGATKSPTFG